MGCVGWRDGDGLGGGGDMVRYWDVRSSCDVW